MTNNMHPMFGISHSVINHITPPPDAQVRILPGAKLFTKKFNQKYSAHLNPGLMTSQVRVSFTMPVSSAWPPNHSSHLADNNLFDAGMASFQSLDLLFSNLFLNSGKSRVGKTTPIPHTNLSLPNFCEKFDQKRY